MQCSNVTISSVKSFNLTVDIRILAMSIKQYVFYKWQACGHQIQVLYSTFEWKRSANNIHYWNFSVAATFCLTLGLGTKNYIIGEKWRKLSDEEKKEYKEIAEDMPHPINILFMKPEEVGTTSSVYDVKLCNQALFYVWRLV